MVGGMLLRPLHLNKRSTWNFDKLNVVLEEVTALTHLDDESEAGDPEIGGTTDMNHGVADNNRHHLADGSHDSQESLHMARAVSASGVTITPPEVTHTFINARHKLDKQKSEAESHPAFDLTGLDPVFRLRADLLGSCVPHVYLHGDILLHSWSLRDFTDVVVAGGDGGPDGLGAHEQDAGLAVHPLGGHDLRVPLRKRYVHSIICPYCKGYLRDVTGSYDLPFIFLASCTMFSSLCLLATPLVERMEVRMRQPTVTLQEAQ
ncbi:hypothetical protein C0Q70_21130 [Pomacea canaliculata]|uniref:LITAF domain-containing protein n=1 Tax=Pomacea canaliculata TaxID=400727 RepID=A0A2T7NBM6_POMCA|nr:hypothetical protein C0Q70_21130 [Pomacea canaliculata]